MTGRELIERAVQREGFKIASWDEEHENGLTAIMDGKFVITDDAADDDKGLYAGDEGTLMACVVGAAKYSNEHVSWSLLTDGYDTNVDIPEPSTLDFA